MLCQSAYNNEEITDPIPSFVHMGDTYFHQKELHANAMVAEYGLPTLFATLSMAEKSMGTSIYYTMENIDNGDTIPTIRPLHITLFYINHIQALKKAIWMTVLTCIWMGNY